MAPRVPSTGADGIEIYTGYRPVLHAAVNKPYYWTPVPMQPVSHTGSTCRNIGHDVDLNNFPPLMSRMPTMNEASIGHELTADARVMGFTTAIGAYKAALRQAA
jgi:pyridoxine 5-phosphate synthase